VSKWNKATLYGDKIGYEIETWMADHFVGRWKSCWYINNHRLPKSDFNHEGITKLVLKIKDPRDLVVLKLYHGDKMPVEIGSTNWAVLHRLQPWDFSIPPPIDAKQAYVNRQAEKRIKKRATEEMARWAAITSGLL